MGDVRKISELADSKWIKRWAVGSDTRDAEYTVAVDNCGNYGCTCPAWKFQRTKMLAKNHDWKCKHVKAVMASLDIGAGAKREVSVVTGRSRVEVSVRLIDLADLD